nr:GDSL esterase/lipase 1-like [Ipomoea batatas]
MASFCTMALLALLFCNPVHCLDDAAFFVFGDSLFDAGNNNYINTTNDFSANFPPYGESFFPPSGRFSNGRLIPDFIAEYAKLPLIPAYFRTKEGGVTKGVNFASAGAGSLAETYHGKMLGAKKSNKLLPDAVYMFSIGGNDYISPLMSNSSLFFSSYTEEEEYMDMVVGNFTTVIEEIYKEGGRKFVFVSLQALGCVPYARALNIQQTKSGDCMEKLQDLAKMHNEALLKAINKLEKNLQDFRGIPSCGGKRQVKEYELCQNVGDYLFFDYGHATEKANRLTAKLLWEGSTYVIGPYNVKSLFQL